VTENSLLLFAIVAIVAFILLALPGLGRGKRQRSNSKSNGLGKLRRTGNYWGVTIKRGKCAAIRQTTGRQFTFDEAPMLPIAGCKALRCSCTYQGLRERRRQQRRTANDRRDAVRFDAQHPERRSGRERRRGHANWSGPYG
jgi:hypothetical protein